MVVMMGWVGMDESMDDQMGMCGSVGARDPKLMGSEERRRLNVVDD